MEQRQVAPWIPAAAKIMIVGQSPGRTEAREGRPFVGASGRMLRRWLSTVGLDPDYDVAYTNVTLEYHQDDPNYSPTAAECAAAWERVDTELRVSGARAVVLLGGVAGRVNPGRVWGEPRSGAAEPPMRVFRSYHPAYYLRCASYRERVRVETEVIGVLRAARDEASGVAELPMREPEEEKEMVI